MPHAPPHWRFSGVFPSRTYQPWSDQFDASTALLARSAAIIPPSSTEIHDLTLRGEGREQQSVAREEAWIRYEKKLNPNTNGAPIRLNTYGVQSRCSPS